MNFLLYFEHFLFFFLNYLLFKKKLKLPLILIIAPSIKLINPNSNFSAFEISGLIP
jgi:hypothetical protein